MSKKSLTLLEILVSITILAMVIAGMANVFVAGKRWLLHSRSRMTGGELGKLFLDPLQMQVRQDQWGNNCLSNDTAVDCPGQETIDRIIYIPTYERSNLSGTTLRKVKLTLRWNEPTP